MVVSSVTGNRAKKVSGHYRTGAGRAKEDLGKSSAARRLKMLLAMLKAGQFTKPPKLGVLYALCLAVVAEVPLRDSSKT
jgi:hypothetical protein